MWGAPLYQIHCSADSIWFYCLISHSLPLIECANNQYFKGVYKECCCLTTYYMCVCSIYSDRFDLFSVPNESFEKHKSIPYVSILYHKATSEYFLFIRLLFIFIRFFWKNYRCSQHETTQTINVQLLLSNTQTFDVMSWRSVSCNGCNLSAKFLLHIA